MYNAKCVGRPPFIYLLAIGVGSLNGHPLSESDEFVVLSYSFVSCLSLMPIDHTSLARRRVKGGIDTVFVSGSSWGRCPGLPFAFQLASLLSMYVCDID